MSKINAMRKAVLLFSVCALIAACGGKTDQDNPSTASFKENEFTRLFPAINLKYQLSDSLLARTGKNEKPIAAGKNYIPDSLIQSVFGKGAKPKFYPLGKVANGSEELYVLVNGADGDKQAVFLLCFDGALNYKDGLVFCETDNDPKTFCSASIDKSFNIMIRKEIHHSREDISVVDRALVFNAEGFFMDVMNNDPEQKLAIVNPIDTLSAKGKFSGDYAASAAQNFISIRDGKDSNEFVFYYYMDKGEDCRNTIRDVARFTSKNTAVFKKDGDPCVFTFTFGNNLVTLKEEDGCGNYRGLNCTLNGSFSKKKKLNLAADTAKKEQPVAPKPKPKTTPEPKKEVKKVPVPPKKAPVVHEEVQ